MKKTITALNQEPVVSPKRNVAQRASWFIIILFFQPPPSLARCQDTAAHGGEHYQEHRSEPQILCVKAGQAQIAFGG